jgi:tetratricopeptide (TPR) repeat protein
MPSHSAARSHSSAVALGVVEGGPEAVRPRIVSGALGDAGSRENLDRLRAALADIRQMTLEPLLHRSVAALQQEDAAEGAHWALKALDQDERCGQAWYLLAIAREKAGDFASSVQCYESALKLLPDHTELCNHMGRLAYRLGMVQVAEQLFAHFLVGFPDNYEGANNYACTVRDQNRFDEAIEVLRPAIMANPGIAMLWNTMGTVLSEQGEFDTARTFFEEALRLDPMFSKSRYNRGNARLALGDAPGALEDCEAAIPGALSIDERAMMELARSTHLINLGRIAEGWDAYEARLHPHLSGVVGYLINLPRWTPETDLAGKRMLVIGEQGLGDEVLFANLLPDVIEAVGPKGKVYIAVEQRLVELFARSFPQAEVIAHGTYLHQGKTVRGVPLLDGPNDIEIWTPIGCLLRRFRNSVDAFPDRPRFLTADPARVAYWKQVLATQAPKGPKIGLLWKSMKQDSARQRYFSPFDQWEPVLRIPGVVFINMQYGDCSAEIAEARERLGVEIWQPPGIDLKQDLDDVAALSCALDLMIGPANASSNIAAACGAPLWLISTPGAWPRLGTDRYPWYPQARVFLPPAFNQWAQVMAQVAEALGEAFPKAGT